MSTYTQHYSNFIGVDMSSDPRSVARNRLAYAENMWRDYESEQGSAIETFPGFRRFVRDLGAVHGLFGYRAKSGEKYLVVHAGTNLYSFESEYIAALDDFANVQESKLENVTLADSDSTAFIFNNNLYILDGSNFIVVSSVTDKNGAVSVTANEVNAYVPTTYFDGKPLEQRNMLADQAYEIITEANMAHIHKLYCTYSDEISTDHLDPYKKRIIKGLSSDKPEELTTLIIGEEDYKIEIVDQAFYQMKNINNLEIICKDELTIGEEAFADCEDLETISICIYTDNPRYRTSRLIVNESAFANCSKLSKVYVYCSNLTYDNLPVDIWGLDVANLSLDTNDFLKTDLEYDTVIKFSEAVKSVISVKDKDSETLISYKTPFTADENNLLPAITVRRKSFANGVKVKVALDPLRFSTIENVKNFKESNPDYQGTGVAAINGCTKCAVFDGRIFLTGNPTLPNTVFYSHRNLTGANDPTYFGAFNYFNDGDGNTPNVDLLSTPSMLMVLKNNTVQDGSVYYHTPAYNEDEYSGDLVPRVYPSTSGAAGLGCAGNTVPGTVACNFLDDPVFLSTRGLEAVGKQTVNLERTVTHRSSNVDRLLIKEDLSKASLAEWKGYLVICCSGNFYLADSRVVSQHQDGSYQYEWFYLKGLGCYDNYSGGYEYLREWPTVDDEGNSLADCELYSGNLIKEDFTISDGGFAGTDADVTVYPAQRPDGSQFYFYAHGSLALEPIDEERQGVGEFYPARKIAVVGERLFFGTDGGDVCVINTDKRGVPDYEGQIFETDRISSRWYSFAGVRYPSVCVTRLDDCSKKSLAKGTVPGTTLARFKMMPGSHLRANVSLNGRDFKKIGEAHASRYDSGDLNFDNFSFTENEDAVVVLRELTRNWVDKQYSFVSDGFREPFGLYEISYLYTVNGKIRRPFALIERK